MSYPELSFAPTRSSVSSRTSSSSSSSNDSRSSNHRSLLSRVLKRHKKEEDDEPIAYTTVYLPELSKTSPWAVPNPASESDWDDAQVIGQENLAWLRVPKRPARATRHSTSSSTSSMSSITSSSSHSSQPPTYAK
ncbi:hypothetical protein SISNIDRAFT_456383 [Sistotremastrum niveocremeum HHB9708]|uniref:Uncharacterized protein n=1 Tax=Sistotremastrum niveocremeum HHB9708 TaxID=1314777 RepID=A0A164STZ6_9AGAM|nr:hypothetical protein SISNIDRAFT_456383 [Sistotremastrum niveocremeum HHB9708]